MQKQNRIFGTDGVRGRANHAPMTVETALSLGRAAGQIFRKQEGRQRVVIGKDTRLSCYMFENALIAGLCSMGIDTLMLGPFPTPGVAFITRAYRADAGIVISASHNAYYDNGIKFFSSNGYKFSDSWENEMEKLVQTNDFSTHLPPDHLLGKNARVTDADGRYIEYTKATIPKHLTLNDLKIVLDCSNGATHRIAPLVFEELGAETFIYGSQPDGLNINKDCGSTHPTVIQKAVLEHQAHIGIALDGDGDRVILVDEKAQIIDGDTILAICAREMKKKGTLKNNRIVGTVMSNFGFLKAMEKIGIEVIKSKVGDRYVVEEMHKHECNLGGEPSGHLIFSDHNTTGDGLVAALQVLGIMIETNTPLSDLASFVKKYPQTLVNVPVREKPPLESLKEVQKRVDQKTKDFDGKGRILLRYSGTEDLCRVMVEGPKIQTVHSIAKELAEAIHQEIGKKEKG